VDQMGKLKTHKGVAKRFKKTGRGKIMHGRAGKRHLLSSKSTNQKRPMRRQKAVADVNKEALERLLPYGI